MPGAACADARVAVDGKPSWFLDQLREEFTLLHFAADAGARREDLLATARDAIVPMRIVTIAERTSHAAAGIVVASDTEGLLAERFDARPARPT